jgi:hypothetical protein
MNKTRKNKKKIKSEISIRNNKNPCIFVSFLEGEGLGNQLFIYAAALTIQEKIDLPICISDGTNNPHSKRNYREILNSIKVNQSLNGKLNNSIQSRINSAIQVTSKRAYILDSWIADTTTAGNKIKNVKLPKDLYQNYQSVIHIVPKLKKILEKNEFNKINYNKYRRSIDSFKTAFMHVRRGDKVPIGQTLNVEYYSNALKKLENNLDIKNVYIYSNDKDWCLSNMDTWKTFFTKNLEYKDISDELETLYSMMLCKSGAILSSSLFGVWGAILGADKTVNSTIIYPLNPAEYAGKTNPLSLPESWLGI